MLVQESFSVFPYNEPINSVARKMFVPQHHRQPVSFELVRFHASVPVHAAMQMQDENHTVSFTARFEATKDPIAFELHYVVTNIMRPHGFRAMPFYRIYWEPVGPFWFELVHNHSALFAKLPTERTVFVTPRCCSTSLAENGTVTVTCPDGQLCPSQPVKIEYEPSNPEICMPPKRSSPVIIAIWAIFLFVATVVMMILVHFLCCSADEADLPEHLRPLRTPTPEQEIYIPRPSPDQRPLTFNRVEYGSISV